MGRPAKTPGAATKAFYLPPAADQHIDKVAATVGGNRSTAVTLIAGVHEALVDAYDPPLGREDRLRILSAMNGVALHLTPPSGWRGSLLGNLAAGSEDGDDDLLRRLRALPKHEVILLAQWAWTAWEMAEREGPYVDLEPFLGAED